MKKIAATFLSVVMLCALFAAPALAQDRDDYPAWRGGAGWNEYRPMPRHPDERPQWAWNNSAQWPEHHDRDDYWHYGDRDDHWHAPPAWGYHDYDRR